MKVLSVVPSYFIHLNFLQVWYTVLRSSGTWYHQVTACNDIELRRTSIAKVLTDDEQNAVANLLANHSADAWIGGIRLAEGSFYWHVMGSGERVMLDPVSEDHWAPGQPDNYRHQENCISLDRENKWKWNDGGCGWVRRVVCELRC